MNTVICVDFDGTVVDHRYPDVGKDAPYAAKWLRRWAELGAKLILFTMRCDSESQGPVLTDAARWFTDRNIPLWGVNENPEQHTWSDSRKVYGNIYVDDAAFGCPLIAVPGFQRLCVDWSVVGPEIERRLISLKDEEEISRVVIEEEEYA